MNEQNMNSHLKKNTDRSERESTKLEGKTEGGTLTDVKKPTAIQT